MMISALATRESGPPEVKIAPSRALRIAACPASITLPVILVCCTAPELVKMNIVKDMHNLNNVQ